MWCCDINTFTMTVINSNKMKRFSIILLSGKYSIQKDNFNNLYAVFEKCNGFYQQKSKWYVNIKTADRYLDNLTK